MSVKNYADMFVRRNALREIRVDDLGRVRALIALIVIKKVDQVRGTLVTGDWSVNETALELFGECGLAGLMTEEAPIYQTKYNVVSLTKEGAANDLFESSCRILSVEELEMLLVDFKNQLSIVSFIPFTLDTTIVDGVDVDSVICKFSDYVQLFWGDKISPSHYTVLSGCIIHAIKELQTHKLTVEDFLETCLKHNVTSLYAWCFEVCRPNSIYELMFSDRKTFAGWFTGLNQSD